MDLNESDDSDSHAECDSDGNSEQGAQDRVERATQQRHLKYIAPSRAVFTSPAVARQHSKLSAPTPSKQVAELDEGSVDTPVPALPSEILVPPVQRAAETGAARADRMLGPGASARGWRVSKAHAGSRKGLKYIAPSGAVFTSRAAALKSDATVLLTMTPGSEGSLVQNLGSDEGVASEHHLWGLTKTLVSQADRVSAKAALMCLAMYPPAACAGSSLSGGSAAVTKREHDCSHTPLSLPLQDAGLADAATLEVC